MSWSDVCGRITRPIVRRLRVGFALKRARTTSRARLAAIRPGRVLVICYGNIYRSPFVAAVLAQSAISSVEVRSAGFHPRTGRETPLEFQEIAKNYGIDLSAHRSRLIDAALVEWADMVLVMDRHNWDRIVESFPAARSKIVWLGGFLARHPLEIIDPYGRGEEEMRAIAKRMYQASEALKRLLFAAG